MENSFLSDFDENDYMNENSISNSSQMYYEKEKMTLTDFVPRESVLSLCSAASHKNASEVTKFMSETQFKDANKQIQKQNDKNVKPEPNIDYFSDYKRNDLTDNGTLPTPPHISNEISQSENSQANNGNKMDKWKLDLKSGGKEEEKQKIKMLNKNSDAEILGEKNVQIEISRKSPCKEKTFRQSLIDPIYKG